MRMRISGTRDTVETAIDLTKSDRTIKWSQVATLNQRRWTSPQRLSVSPPGAIEDFDEELSDVVDALMSEREAEEIGTKSLAVLERELGL